MPENAKEFVDLYNGIDSLLRSKLSLQPAVDFSSVVNYAKQTGLILSKQADYLLLVGRLRNAIIHDNRYKYPTDPIAEPHADTITNLRAIKEFVEKPPSIDVLPKHQPKIFMSSDRLLDCLQHMRENDFSQVVVFDGSKFSLITREDVARWFEKQIVDDDLVISLENVKVEEVFKVNNKDDFNILPRKAKLTELLESFEPRGRKKISAVLITEKGRATETPLNIFTHYDIPEILGRLDLF